MEYPVWFYIMVKHKKDNKYIQCAIINILKSMRVFIVFNVGWTHFLTDYNVGYVHKQ